MMRRRSRTQRRRKLQQKQLHEEDKQNGTTNVAVLEKRSIGSLVLEKLHKVLLYLVIYLGFRRYKSRGLPPVSPEFRTFLAGPGNQVYIVKDFLPLETAERWRSILKTEWNKHLKGEESGWLYTTNNDGHTAQHNQKTRSLADIEQRNATAHTMYEHGYFAYSKWELDPALHALVPEIESTFRSKPIQDRVKSILNDSSIELESELSDLFVTHYDTGDFLSSHSDGVSGTYAFVVSLMDYNPAEGEWQEDYGGELQFACLYPQRQRPEGPERWCETIRPAFNTLVLFRTRPFGVNHQVMPVSYKATHNHFYRFGLTGWYMDKQDKMDEATKLERDKMRGRTPTK